MAKKRSKRMRRAYLKLYSQKSYRPPNQNVLAEYTAHARFHSEASQQVRAEKEKRYEDRVRRLFGFRFAEKVFPISSTEEYCTDPYLEVSAKLLALAKKEQQPPELDRHVALLNTEFERLLLFYSECHSRYQFFEHQILEGLLRISIIYGPVGNLSARDRAMQVHHRSDIIWQKAFKLPS